MRLYVRVGRLVVSMYKPPKVPLQTMLRAMLIALALYPDFLRLAVSGRSVPTLSGSVSRFLKMKEKVYMKKPLQNLSIEACSSMENISSLTCGGRVQLSSFPDVKSLLLSLHVGVLTLIDYGVKRGYIIPPQPAKASPRSRRKLQ